MKDIDTIENAPENWWRSALWLLMLRILFNQGKQLECFKLILEDSLTDESITDLTRIITDNKKTFKDAVAASEILGRKDKNDKD